MLSVGGPVAAVPHRIPGVVRSAAWFLLLPPRPGPLPVRGTPSPFVSVWAATVASSTIRSGSSQSSGGSAVVAAGIVGALPATWQLLLRC